MDKHNHPEGITHYSECQACTPARQTLKPSECEELEKIPSLRQQLEEAVEALRTLLRKVEDAAGHEPGDRILDAIIEAEDWLTAHDRGGQ